MTAKEAREYIARFHLTVGTPPIEYFQLSSGAVVYVNAMTDEDAVAAAACLQDIERQMWAKAPNATMH